MREAINTGDLEGARVRLVDGGRSAIASPRRRQRRCSLRERECRRARAGGRRDRVQTLRRARARRTGARPTRGARQSEAGLDAPRGVALAAREVYCAGGGQRGARLERHVRALAAGEQHDDPAANRVHLVELRVELHIQR